MELQKPVHPPCFRRVVLNVVGPQPNFIQPNVDQQDSDEPREIKNVLFDGNPFTQGWRRNSEGSTGIAKVKKPFSEEEIEAKADGKQNQECAPKGTLRDLHASERQKPAAYNENRNDEQQKAPGIAVRSWVGTLDLERGRDSHGMQCDARWNSDHHKHREHDPPAQARTRVGDGLSFAP